jgi:hypothetical protein
LKWSVVEYWRVCLTAPPASLGCRFVFGTAMGHTLIDAVSLRSIASYGLVTLFAAHGRGFWIQINEMLN